MTNAKPSNKIVPKMTTRFVGETKMSIKNQKAIKIIKAFKGMFG